MNSNDFLNHTFWISVGGEGGQGRGTVRRKKTSVAKLREQLSQPSIDASLIFEEFQGLTKAERDNRKAQPGFLIAGRFRDAETSKADERWLWAEPATNPVLTPIFKLPT